eukprot:gene17399-19826_t
MIADEECFILINRYADFFSLVSNIVNADNWRAFTLQDLFLSVDSMKRKYQCAASEDAWLNVKHDILFQMFLCVLREAVGLPDDNKLPGSLEEFHIPSTVSVACYRRKVVLLMEKYKGYYMQERSEEQAASVLHPAFTKQRDSLIYGVVNESINARGAQESVLDREKVFELLEAHHTDVFKEIVIEFIHAVEDRALPIPIGQEVEYENQPSADDCAQEQQQEAPSNTGAPLNSTLYDWSQTSDPSAAVSVLDVSPTHTRTEQEDSAQEPNLEQNKKQDEKEIDGGEESDLDSSSSSSDDDSYLKGVIPAMAAYMKELERKDYRHRRELMFTGAYIEAFKNNKLDEEAQCYDYTSDAFWTGRGSLKVNGVRVRSNKVGLIATDKGLFMRMVGVKNDELLESIANFHIPSSTPVEGYRGRVSYLMETHRREYMQVDQEESNVHPRYHEQWDTLMHGVVSESISDSGTQAQELNREKVFELLKTHNADTFKQLVLKFIQSIERQALPDPSTLDKRKNEEEIDQAASRPRTVIYENGVADSMDEFCEPDSVRDPSVHRVSPSKAEDKDGESRSSSGDLSYGNQKVEDDATDLCNPSTSSTAKASALTVPQTEPLGLTEAPGAVAKGVASSHVNEHET